MSRRQRTLALSLILGLLAAPLAWAAAPASMPCCPEAGPSAPCASEEGPCPSMVPMPCCDATPVAPSSVSQGSAQGQTVQAAVIPPWPALPEPAWRSTWGTASAELTARASPLRFSVVLLI